MVSKKKSIKMNAGLNTLRTALNLLFPLITVPYISRVLSVEEIGKYNFSYSIIAYGLLIAALGIDKYAVREGAKYRDDKEKIGEFASKVFSINIVATFFAYALLFLYLFLSPKASEYYTCILIFSLEIFFTTIGTEWLYSIFEEYVYITIRSVVFKVISMALLFIFVRKPGDYLIYTGISVLANVGSNILNFIHAKKLCKIKFTVKFNWRELLPPILIIFATNVAIKIYVSSDTTMLGYLTDDYTVGIYSFSGKVYTILKNMLSATLMVSIPRLAFYVGKKMQDEYENLIIKIANSLMILAIPAMIGMMMMSRNIIIILGGKNYEKSQSSLIILCIAIVFSIFSMLFNQGILLPYKREKYTLRSSIVSAVENIGLNFIFIPLLAENGAAITTVLAEITMAVMNYYSSRDVAKKIFKNTTTVKNIATIIPGCIAIVIICIVVTKFVTNIVLQTVLSVGLSVLSYAFVLLIFRNPIAEGILQSIIKRIK